MDQAKDETACCEDQVAQGLQSGCHIHLEKTPRKPQ